MTSPRPKQRQRLSRGKRIYGLSELDEVLQTEPSIWWSGRARASAFFLGWPFRTIIQDLRNKHGGFYRVKREDKDE